MTNVDAAFLPVPWPVGPGYPSRPSPIVPWRPAPRHPRASWFVRLAGAIVGAGASLLLGIVLGSSAQPGAGTAVEGLFPAFGGALAMAGAIVPLPGAIGGALLAPKAWRARGPQDWFWIAVQLAILAVVLGDLLIAVPLLVGGLLTGSGAVLAFVAALVVIVFGLLLFGPFVLPFTFVAAVMWSVGMWLVVGVGRGLGVTGLRDSKVR